MVSHLFGNEFCRTLAEAVGSTSRLAAARSVADVGLSFNWESCYTIRSLKYSLMIVNGTKGPVQVFSAACLAGRQSGPFGWRPLFLQGKANRARLGAAIALL
jgi:hypothetical protein